MKREFLKNLQVNGAALPDVVIDTIMQEHTRAMEAATANTGANGGTGGKVFTQDEVNKIVSDRLAREREKLTQQPQEDEREKALKAREARLDCRDYLDSKKYPAALLEVLDSSDVDRFKSAADKLIEQFPGVAAAQMPPPYAAGTGTQNGNMIHDPIAAAFKPHEL